MAAHSDQHGGAAGAGAGGAETFEERTSLGERAWPVYNIAKIAGFVGIIGGVAMGYMLDPGFRRFYFAYLVAFTFFLSIALGALGFVLLQYLTRAGWSVNVRRAAECLGATMPILFALSAPVLLSVLLNRGDLYRWAQPIAHSADALHGAKDAQGKESPSAAGVAETQGAAGANQGTQGHPAPEKPAVPTVAGDANATAHADEHGRPAATGSYAEQHPSAKGVQPLDDLTLKKRPVLNRWSFTLRIILYFAVWSGIALWYWRLSTEQDRSADVALTERMQARSAPAIILFGVTVTFAAFDLLMSLDPHWFSTMMGVYFLSGSMLAGFAGMILVLGMLQRLGYLTRSVSTEHYHDLGKWLFAFVFFWGYIAFSQYMLLWYANIPEETGWLARRGASSARAHIGPWTYVSLALLLGKLLIPFAGLLSRHVKRRRALLMFWAAWVLVFHYVDLFWVIMPELDGRVHFGLVEVLCFLGVGGVFMASYLRLLAKNPLRPLNDPRTTESLAFQNV
ncbi:MAG TPA: hypothetical protein VER17_03050 [Tepidisphaeraceae bacterium]|nr:hypothetical protein [Tepidisphaeraceae bacterium]